jgi:hypothetical protein
MICLDLRSPRQPGAGEDEREAGEDAVVRGSSRAIAPVSTDTIRAR